MKGVIAIVATGFVSLVVLTQSPTSETAEIKVLAANGIQTVIEDVGQRFERATGKKLATVFATGGAVAKRAQSGEAADVVIAPRQGIDGVVKAGRAAANTVAAIAHTGISVAVRNC